MQITREEYNARLANMVKARRIIRSRLHFAAAVAYSAPTATISFSTGKRHAFGYKIGDTVPDGGGTATEADTDLADARTPPDNAVTYIHAILVRPTAASDPFLLQILDHVLTFTLRMQQKPKIRLGNLADLGGVRGGMSRLSPGPSWLATDKAGYWFEPVNSNPNGRIVFDDPIVWTPDGPDSGLDIEAEIHAAASIDSVNRTAEAATSEVDFAAPQAAGATTNVDLFVQLLCTTLHQKGSL